VDATDVEHTIRYRKKIEKDEEYMRVIKNLGDVNGPLNILEYGAYHKAK
jgi:hypothetical protein